MKNMRGADKELHQYNVASFFWGDVVNIKMYKFLRKTLVVVFAVLSTVSHAFSQEYSFEAEEATLSNGASIQNASLCSGGAQVGNLGGTQNGSVTKVFQVTTGGDYDLSVSYCTADQRSFSVRVNYGKRIELVCPSSGDWSKPATIKLQVFLVSGQNVLVFDNPDNWAPNLDQFSMTPSPKFSISGKLEENGVGISGAVMSLSGAKTSSIMSDENGNYTFSGLTSGKDYTITPSKDGLVFDPPYRAFSLLSADESDQNFQAVPVCTDCIEQLSFGSEGELQYSTQSGTFSVFSGALKIVSSAYSEVRNGDVKISSMDYTDRQVLVEDITDNFGNGKKLTVSLTADGLPEMQQVFYAYTEHDYLMAEVVLKGSSISSNYMAPIVSNKVDVGEQGDNRLLFVPFDNDGFVRYKSNAMDDYNQTTSSEVTAFYENNSRNGVVIGSVEQMIWKTGINGGGRGKELSSLVVFGGYSDASVTRDRREHGSISGDELKSPKIFVGYFTDWRDGMEEYGRAVATSQPRYVFDWEQPTPFGWNSWGALQTNINLTNATAVVDFFDKSIPDFRNGETAYIDLDSYWDNMVPGGWEGDFSQLTTFANYCKSKGLKPGIYWAPFVDWGKYDRRVEGSVYSYASTWTRVNGTYHDEDGGRAMDPTHPATKQRLEYIIDKFIACGFEMIKVDFLGHAAIEADSFYDPNVKTGMQAYQEGMKYLIDQLQGKMLVYAAISPNLATGRYAHSRRIACDAYGDIGATEYTLNSNTYGWWQSQIYNFIDGDMLVLGNNSLGENRARLTSGVINGTLITADDFSTTGQWTDRAKSLFQNKSVLDVARDGVAFRPVEGNSTSSASEVFVKNDGEDYDVAVVNYGNAKTFNLDLGRLGLEQSGYSLTELFSGQQYSVSGSSFSLDVPARDAMLLKFTKGIPNAVEDDRAKIGIQVFPNPTNGKLYIRCEEPIRVIKLYSSSGILMQMLNEGGNMENTLDLGAYASGLYFCVIKTKNDVTIVQKVVKKD